MSFCRFGADGVAHWSPKPGLEIVRGFESLNRCQFTEYRIAANPLALGARNRRFESCYSDQFKLTTWYIGAIMVV